MSRWSKDNAIPSYMSAHTSIYYKVPYAHKDKFKGKYSARWVPDSKEWRVNFSSGFSDDDGWKRAHKMILQLNDELRTVGSSINCIKDESGILDDYETFKMVLGKEREVT